MPTFLFWNIAGKPLQDLISALADAHDVDVLVLAECNISPAALLLSLKRTKPAYQFSFGYSRRLMFMTKFHAGFLKPVFESDRISIRKLNLPARKEILIAAAHLPSRIGFSEASLDFECVSFAHYIEEQERIAGHRRTVVLGDLNVNPFDKGLVAAEGFHAVMSRDVASRGHRTIQGRQYHFFYNPMWSYFGDCPDGPAGTYYYERAEHVNYFWNMFDQVLIRPELLQNFECNQVQVLTKAGASSLVGTSGRPDKTSASDHLPVLLKLDF